jgi:hypothetical protein
MSFPTFLKLSRAALARRDIVRRIVQRSRSVPRHAVAETAHAFAMTEDELFFARALLAVRSQLWLFRTHQRGFAGDFVVVNLSSPDPAYRLVFAVELKMGSRVRVHGGTPLQLRNAGLVVAHIARTGVIADSCAPEMLTGDARAVIEHLRAARHATWRPRGRASSGDRSVAG